MFSSVQCVASLLVQMKDRSPFLKPHFIIRFRLSSFRPRFFSFIHNFSLTSMIDEYDDNGDDNGNCYVSPAGHFPPYGAHCGFM